MLNFIIHWPKTFLVQEIYFLLNLSTFIFYISIAIYMCLLWTAWPFPTFTPYFAIPPHTSLQTVSGSVAVDIIEVLPWMVGSPTTVSLRWGQPRVLVWFYVQEAWTKHRVLLNIWLLPCRIASFLSRGHMTFYLFLLPSPSSYCSLHDRPINQKNKGWGKDYQLYLESQQTQKMADASHRIIFSELRVSGFS